MNLQLKLSELLDLHDSTIVPEIGLTDSLGDSYLYKNNPLFRKIRNEFKKQNYAYTNKDFCNYAVLPYASLSKILKEKKVPYFDNVTVYREIEKASPNKFKCPELIKVKSNYTLHESAHCVAFEYLKDLNFEIPALTKESQQAFKAIMAESFANTVEAFGNHHNTTETDRLFYELNSYAQMNKKAHTALAQTCDLIGPKTTYKLLFIAYLYSNSLMNEVPNKHFEQLLNIFVNDEAAKQKALNSTSLKKILAYAFDLNTDFRLQTTAFYFQSIGLTSSIFKLVQYDIIQILKSKNVIQSFLKKSEQLFE